MRNLIIERIFGVLGYKEYSDLLDAFVLEAVGGLLEDYINPPYYPIDILNRLQMGTSLDEVKESMKRLVKEEKVPRRYFRYINRGSNLE